MVTDRRTKYEYEVPYYIIISTAFYSIYWFLARLLPYVLVPHVLLTFRRYCKIIFPAFCLRHQLAGREKRKAYSTETAGTETASYKVLPPGNTVFSIGVRASLPAVPSTILIPLPCTSNGHGTHRFAPAALQSI
jgi:hypothetical protein